MMDLIIYQPSMLTVTSIPLILLLAFIMQDADGAEKKITAFLEMPVDLLLLV